MVIESAADRRRFTAAADFGVVAAYRRGDADAVDVPGILDERAADLAAGDGLDADFGGAGIAGTAVTLLVALDDLPEGAEADRDEVTIDGTDYALRGIRASSPGFRLLVLEAV